MIDTQYTHIQINGNVRCYIVEISPNYVIYKHSASEILAVCKMADFDRIYKRIPTPQTVYLNIYEDGAVFAHKTLYHAENASSDSRIRIARKRLTYTPGDMDP